MRREIDEQPQALAATIDALAPRLPEIARLAHGCRNVSFYARGTSDNAAAYGRVLCENAARLPAALGAPSTATAYATALRLNGTLVVALSQSGATGEIVETALWARRRGARVLGITNTAGSALEDACDLTLVTAAGVEHAVPATKSHIVQLVALALLTAALAPGSSGIERQVAELPAACAELTGDAARARVDEIVAALGAPSTLVAVGRGGTLATAQELALKVEETCRVPCRGLSAADLQHGPVAAVGAGVPAVVVAAAGPTAHGLARMGGRLAAAGARVVAISDDAGVRASAAMSLDPPSLGEWLFPVTAIVPAQQLAEALARCAGLDPDRPGGLSKITQTFQ
jgi:glucosamine--fructose-6-phosphate aminotransferase (isomerizing)